MPALQDPHEVILSRILQLDASEFEELTRALLEALGFEKTEGLQQNRRWRRGRHRRAQRCEPGQGQAVRPSQALWDREGE